MRTQTGSDFVRPVVFAEGLHVHRNPSGTSAACLGGMHGGRWVRFQDVAVPVQRLRGTSRAMQSALMAASWALRSSSSAAPGS